MPQIVYNNSSQKDPEKTTNAIRKSSGLFNNWVGKGDKTEKNHKNITNLKESHSIPNFH